VSDTVSEPGSRRRRRKGLDWTTAVVRPVATIAALAIAVWAALRPDVIYAPVPKAVLFVMVALVPAVLLAGEAVVRLDLKWPGFAVTATGTAALAITLLLILDHISQPEERVVAFEVREPNGDPFVGLEVAGNVRLTAGALEPQYCAKGNKLYFVFPEQVGDVELGVQTAGRWHYGTIRYAGERRPVLTIGEDLKAAGR